MAVLSANITIFQSKEKGSFAYGIPVTVLDMLTINCHDVPQWNYYYRGTY